MCNKDDKSGSLIKYFTSGQLIICDTSLKAERYESLSNIGIDTKIEVIVASPTTWEAHHSPRAKPEGCGELPRSLVTQQWPKWRYQFLFYHDETKSITNKQKNAR